MKGRQQVIQRTQVTCRNARNHLQRLSIRYRGAARMTRLATRVASRLCGMRLRQGVGPGLGQSLHLEQDGECMLDGSSIPTHL